MLTILPHSHLKGNVTVPGDKSISHRAVMLGSLALGTTEIRGFLKGADCLSTIDCFRNMGIHIEEKDETILVHGKGLYGLTAPQKVLDVGNSGTTTRLISGILAGQPFESTLSGDSSLNSRPMNRIIRPLRQMGAQIRSENADGCAPLHISPGRLHGIDYHSPVASAQVKSCILLAGLYADSPTSVTEPSRSRDHTERMLRIFGADIRREGNRCSLIPQDRDQNHSNGSQTAGTFLKGQKIIVPGDISSAAYYIAAGLITPDSEIMIRNVGINQTRSGILKVCHAMGADLTRINEREESGEPVADILVRTSRLRGTVIEGDIIPTLIDELPVIALMACFARGKTIIRDAGELRVKESDRIALVSENLSAMGADIKATEDGFIINENQTDSGSCPPSPLHGAQIHCRKDHRIAMTFAIAGMNARGQSRIDDDECVEISYPGFFRQLEEL